MNILRVFPKRNKATPDDELVRIGFPSGDLPEFDRVHVSVTFTYQKEKAEAMAEAWAKIASTEIGGPAYDDPGGEFTPGMYLKKGNVITSRGCPRHCWFCLAAKREGQIRELKIHDGWNVHDNNLLACSDDHIKNVFAMLKTQKERAAFTGGLDTKLMKPWIAELLTWLNPRVMFLAYDTPDDREPFVETVKMLRAAEFPFKGHAVACFVLIGYPHDTIEKATERLWFVAEREVMPYAMLYRPPKGEMNKDWQSFQREWAHPMITGMKVKHFAKTGKHLIIDIARTQPKKKEKSEQTALHHIAAAEE